MDYQRIEYYSWHRVPVVRLVPIGGQLGRSARQLRDELVDLATRTRPRDLVVDFADRHCWPVETLGALAHAKNVMQVKSRIRCAGMSLRLQAACSLLRFEGHVLDLYDSVHAAVHDSFAAWPPAVPALPDMAPCELFGAA